MKIEIEIPGPIDDYEQYENTPEAADSPFVVHAYGMDDVYPARSWLEAVALATGVNIGVVEHATRRPDTSVFVWATPYTRQGAIEAGVIGR